LKGILPPPLSFAHHCLYQHEQGVNADIMNGGCCDYAVMFDVGNYLMVSGHSRVPSVVGGNDHSLSSVITSIFKIMEKTFALPCCGGWGRSPFLT
jgi:hypothetical protein